MNNYEKYVNAFKTALGLDDESIIKELAYQAVAEWDSVGHMELVSEIEDAFDIAMDTDDIIDFNSFEKGMEILKKYSVNIGE